MVSPGWLLFLCFWTSGAVAAAAAAGVTEMKSNSPDAPMEARVHATGHRIKRGTSGSRLTYEERLDFLKAHNDFRADTNPEAADMQFMVWHEELASMAQEWADGCQWKHGNPERDPKPFNYIGQNIYMSTGSSVTGKDVTTSWYNEVNDYTYSSNTCAEGKVCGHYTQVVWANTDSLGCAKTECEELAILNQKNAIFVVCNYGPGGNYVGQKPYTNGTKCSSCPTDKPKCNNGLCAPDPLCGDKSCENGGTLDAASCECKCADGYNGDTCSSAGDVIVPIHAVYGALSLLALAMANFVY